MFFLWTEESNGLTRVFRPSLTMWRLCTWRLLDRPDWPSALPVLQNTHWVLSMWQYWLLLCSLKWFAMHVYPFFASECWLSKNLFIFFVSHSTFMVFLIVKKFQWRAEQWATILHPSSVIYLHISQNCADKAASKAVGREVAVLNTGEDDVDSVKPLTKLRPHLSWACMCVLSCKVAIRTATALLSNGYQWR
jgi:hypothetical protein